MMKAITRMPGGACWEPRAAAGALITCIFCFQGIFPPTIAAEGVPYRPTADSGLGGSLVCVGDVKLWPPKPPADDVFTAIDTGTVFSCGLHSTGWIECWSADERFAQPPQLLPPKGNNFTALAAGATFVAGLLKGGEVVVNMIQNAYVHYDLYHEVTYSDSNSSDYSWVPGNPAEADPSTYLSANGANLCGLKKGGQVECFAWADNSSGEPNPRALQAPNPPEGQAFTSVSAGLFHACALTTRGEIVCWGDRREGKTAVPDPPLGERYIDMSVGNYHSCGLLSNSSIVCWGNDDSYETEPPQLPAGSGFSDVAAGAGQTCAVLTNGTVLCFGFPLGGLSAAPPEGQHYVEISTSQWQTCALLSNGTVDCVLNALQSSRRDALEEPPAGNDFTGIDSFGLHTCAVRTDGSVQCWGDNSWNQSMAPKPPPGEKFMVAATGGRHSCGLLSSGTVQCWGFSGNGQGDVPDELFRDVAAGGNFTCGIVADGRTVACWGDDSNGQTLDIEAPQGQVFTSVAAGSSHAAATLSSGQMDCWGNGNDGQTAPRKPPPGEGYVAAACGGSHTCGLLSNGSIWCWGSNSYGQSSPPEPPPEQYYTSLAAGRYSTVATLSNGSAVGWGDNTWAQLDLPEPEPGRMYTASSTGTGFSCVLSHSDDFNTTLPSPNSTSGWSPSSDSSTTDGSGGGSWLGMILGIVGGVGVLLLLLCCGAGIVWRKRRKQLQQQQRRVDPHKVISTALSREVGSLADTSWVIEASQLKFVRLCGKGAYGEVFLGQLCGAPVAIKRLHGGELLSSVDESQVAKATRALAREIQLMTQVHSPYVVLFLGVCLDPLACVTEYCARGSLFELLQKATQDFKLAALLTWEKRLRMALHGALGMGKLHSLGIIHRDLKSPNLMVDDAFKVKVGDFGLSVLLGEEGLGTATVESGSTIKHLNRRWMAPEVAVQLMSDHHPQQPFTKASDVYSFGLVLLELATFRIPFYDMSDTKVFVANSQGSLVPELPQADELVGGEFPGLQPFLDLMLACLARDPDQRPGFVEVADRLRSVMRQPKNNDYAANGNATKEVEGSPRTSI